MPLPSAFRRTDYAPEADGADCAGCPLLQAEGPVRSEINGASWAIVGESPGAQEVIGGRPLIGPSGMELQDALEHVGLHRRDFDYLNRMSCRPPGDRLSGLLSRISASNKKRQLVNTARRKAHKTQRDGSKLDLLTLIPTPMACCAPRFDAELERYACIIPMGATAAQGVLPGLGRKKVGILAIRGTLFEVPRPDGKSVKVLPTVHPSFVLREPRWRRVFRRDVDRAKRWFRGELKWNEPRILYHPSPDQLARFLRTEGVRYWPWDVETDYIKHGQSPADLRLRCIGIGQEGHSVLVVPWHTLELAPDEDPFTEHFYFGRDRRLIHELLGTFLESAQHRKIGHNAGNFDRLNVLGQLGYAVNGLVDTMLMHCLADSELPHTLALCGSYYTDVHAWKADHTATEAKTDRELWRYNALDVAVNGRIFEPLAADLEQRKQTHMMPLMHAMQKVCVGLHRTGLYVRQGPREAHRQRLQAQAIAQAAECRELLAEMRLTGAVAAARAAAEAASPMAAFGGNRDGLRGLDQSDDATDPLDTLVDDMDADIDISDEEVASFLGVSALASDEFNPGSSHQKRKILYEEWGLPVPAHLKRKDAYTPGGDLSTSATVLRAMLASPYLTEQQVNFLLAAMRYAEAVKAFGTFVHPLEHDNVKCIIDKRDGRVHASWRNHVAVTTRLASSPNQQNIPRELRDMYGPEDGNGFAYADFDQVEHRVAVARWGGERYLEAYNTGLDPHQVTMYLIFGDRMWRWSGQPITRFKKAGIGGLFDRMRDLAKRVLYASQYGADDITVHRVITSATDKNGKLMYRDLTLTAVAGMCARLKANWPELMAGWDREVSFFRLNGYIEEPVTGRRRYLAEEKLTEIVNFPIQGAASGIINKATLRVVEEYPFFGPRGLGLVNHMHDSMTLELLLAHVERGADDLTALLTCTDRALPDMTFPAKGKVVTQLAA